MKKIIALALVLISIFALCACGEAASPAEPVVKEKIVEVEKEVPVVPEEYVKYQGLIDALEAEDYDKAYELIHDMVPVPEATEVEITNDNFFDYFELHMDYEPARYVQKDSSGNVTTFSLVPAYVLKDEYKIATDSEHQSKLEIGVKFKELMYWDAKKSVDIDFENLTYNVKAKKADRTDSFDQLLEGHIWGFEDGTATFCATFNASAYMTNQKDYAVQTLPEKDVEFISATGTLYLYD